MTVESINITITPLEVERYNTFKSAHCSSIDIIINFTGIGTKITLKCTGCGETKDITDYDTW